MKICPECGSNKVIMFDSDNDLCEKCGKWFPAVGEVKCEAGCKAFTGEEIKHHPDCYFYPESFTKMYDDLKVKSKKLEKALKDMHFAYINKDGENPHQFETEAMEQYNVLLPEQTSETTEKKSHKTIEWYQAQAQELMDIRKAFYRLLGDTANGNDAYFPDLVEKELRKLKDGNTKV